MFEFLGNALMSVLGGGVTGLAGAVLTTWGELAKLKEANRHAEQLRVQDLEIAKAEAEGRLAVARSEAEAAIGTAELAAFAESYKHDRATYSNEALGGMSGFWGNLARFLLALVDVARGFIRPGATAYFIGLSTYLTVVAVDLIEQLPAAAVEDLAGSLIPQIVLTVLYLTTTIILWWFGIRQKAAPGRSA